MAKKDAWDSFIDDLVEDSEIKVCTSGRDVKHIILTNLENAYKGKASKARIESVADDITESVCLRLGIPQDESYE